MSSQATTMTIKSRFDSFAASIRPTDKHIEEARRQVEYMEKELHNRVAEDETFTLTKILRAGSNAKHTSLRRNEDNSWDVDLGAYFEGEKADKKEFNRLLAFAEQQLRDIYPSKEAEDIEAERSAVRIKFRSGIKLNVDVAPIISDDSLHVENGGWIPRPDKWRLTSVTAHNTFVGSRSSESASVSGPVKFNKLVRLVKWWNNRLDDDAMISIFCDHLTAAAVEHMGGVTDAWQTSIREVFRFIAQVHDLREPIVFDDYYDPSDASLPTDPVVVMDVVNPENNVAAQMDEAQRAAYAAAAQDAYDAACYARIQERNGEIEEAVDIWCEIFGEEFRTLPEAS